MMARTISYVDVAGPSVATILARLIRELSGGVGGRKAVARLRVLETDGDIGRADGRRQFGLTHEIGIHARGRGATLGDGPDDQRLSAAGVTGDENARRRGQVLVVATDVAALGELSAELLFEAARSGPVKPIAMRTRSAGMSRSVPLLGTRRPSTNSVSATRSARTSPTSLPRNSTVEAR